MAYAVISDRGSQYTVKPGQRVRIDKRDGAPGDKVDLRPRPPCQRRERRHDGRARGRRRLASRRPSSRHGRDKKIIVFKKRRRKGYRRKQGHRQDFTEVRIDTVAGA